jgi:hypothetical protein
MNKEGNEVMAYLLIVLAALMLVALVSYARPRVQPAPVRVLVNRPRARRRRI